jgi:ribose 5-phosphate isomerase B
MNNLPKISIGSDHAGFELKGQVIKFLEGLKYQVKDFGCYSAESMDYPDVAHPVAESVAENKDTLGVLICGSGNGVCITANKHKGVRASLCWLPELGSLARQHNNANIICLPARFVDKETAFEILSSYLNATFEGGRHQNRVNKIDC